MYHIGPRQSCGAAASHSNLKNNEYSREGEAGPKESLERVHTAESVLHAAVRGLST